MRYKKISGILDELHQTDLKKFSFPNTTLILIHHLLPTHIDFFNFLSTLFDKIRFIPIPYSVNLFAKNELDTSNNIHIEIPGNIEELPLLFEETIRKEIMLENHQV